MKSRPEACPISRAAVRLYPSHLWRLILSGAVLVAGSRAAHAQTAAEPGSFQSETLNLRFSYPPQLVPRDAAEALAGGRLTILGFSDAMDSKPGGVTACLRPVLLARTPEGSRASSTSERPLADGSGTVVTVTPSAAATVLLAELDIECLSGAEQVSGRKELPVMAQQFLATPGMAAVAQPATYTIGSQKVYMAAAQGHPRSAAAAGADSTQPGAATPFTIFTMAVATNWNNHLLVWFMSANQIGLLDQVSKSKVRFGRASAAPLYPRALGGDTAAPPPQ